MCLNSNLNFKFKLVRRVRVNVFEVNHESVKTRGVTQRVTTDVRRPWPQQIDVRDVFSDELGEFVVRFVFGAVLIVESRDVHLPQTVQVGGEIYRFATPGTVEELRAGHGSTMAVLFQPKMRLGVLVVGDVTMVPEIVDGVVEDVPLNSASRG